MMELTLYPYEIPLTIPILECILKRNELSVVYIAVDLALCCSFLSSLITLLLCGGNLLF